MVMKLISPYFEIESYFIGTRLPSSEMMKTSSCEIAEFKDAVMLVLIV